VGAVQPLGELGFGIIQIRDQLIGRQWDLLAPVTRLIEREVASYQDQPGSRIARGAVLRPALQRAQAGFLKGFLRCVEIAKIAQERRHCLGPRRRERGIDPGHVGHFSWPPGLK
jgi:hypothetical protein